MMMKPREKEEGQKEGKRKKNEPVPGPVEGFSECVDTWLEATCGGHSQRLGPPIRGPAGPRGEETGTTDDGRTRRKKTERNDEKAGVGII
jgi:hypothetical protein